MRQQKKLSRIEEAGPFDLSMVCNVPRHDKSEMIGRQPARCNSTVIRRLP
jgi:hypothetical protein